MYSWCLPVEKNGFVPFSSLVVSVIKYWNNSSRTIFLIPVNTINALQLNGCLNMTKEYSQSKFKDG